jgi:hypothetical protein
MILIMKTFASHRFYLDDLSETTETLTEVGQGEIIIRHDREHVTYNLIGIEKS